MSSEKNREPASENFYNSTPKIMYGVMKELQRFNALKALELKLKITLEPGAAVPFSFKDIDNIMLSNPAGTYGN